MKKLAGWLLVGVLLIWRLAQALVFIILVAVLILTAIPASLEGLFYSGESPMLNQLSWFGAVIFEWMAKIEGHLKHYKTFLKL